MASGQIIWNHKAKITSDSNRWNQYTRLSQFRSAPVSLGHGNVCIVDIEGNLTILDLTTGQQKAHAYLPEHRDISFSTPRGQSPSYNLTAHPTMELCFAIVTRALLVISTKTAQVIKTLQFSEHLPRQNWSWTRLHFGKRPIAEGGGERAWLLCDAWNYAGQVWIHGPADAEAIVSYEIDLEKLELVQAAVWKIAHLGMRIWTIQNSSSLSRDDIWGIPQDFAGVHLRFLNPVTRMGCICVAATSCQLFQIWTVKFKQTGVIASAPGSGKYPVTIYEVEDHQRITLPEKKTGKNGSSGGTATSIAKKTGKPNLPRRRREFLFKGPPSLLDLHFSERYMAFTTSNEIYLFGFMPRW